MATIEDVAALAGVSVATVSRVLNDSSSVRPATAETVRQAIRTLGYVPNLSARNLRRNESRVVLALAPNFSNPYYSHILTGMSDAAHLYGYSMLLCSTDGKEANERDTLSMLETHRADGAVVLGCGTDWEWMDDYAGRFPLVLCCEYGHRPVAPTVSVDNYAAARETVRYLLSLGHRRLAMLSASNRLISTELRTRGFSDEISAAGIDPESCPIACADGDYSFSSSYSAARELLRGGDRPTAVFCVSDIVALGVISAAVDMGIRVPEELSVTGFDDVDYTTMFHPYLTTVFQPCYEMGKKSMEILLDCMNGKRPSQDHFFLPHQLKVRESTDEYKQEL